MPGSMALFNKWRPRDINLELGVAQDEGAFEFTIYNEPAVNTLSDECVLARKSSTFPYRIKDVIEIEAKPLSWILDRYALDRKIDFLSVDVEGYDLDVLKSNDWQRYRPSIVLVEILHVSLEGVFENPVVKFMREQGYGLLTKIDHTAFFEDLLVEKKSARGKSNTN
ncbi:methyltransferase FkbM [Luminiphilus syltensis NOR5-1B]|uniref:Methyltransferase FkbM n=2 Tax=Luminiphilus TaxID=1341118 RepID=B8KUZ0_9GAMM|nr:methyltransferase FkbM [Luminiphilus syltensis NOR5-1B]